MTEKVKIKAKEREITGKAVKKLRRDGLTPVILYGQDRKPLPLSIDAHGFSLLYREAGGNTIVEVEIEKVDGGKEKKNVLIHEIEHDPVTQNILHADLLQINMAEKITAGVPLHFVGDSIAVIELQGSLLTPKDEVEVECLPADLPHEIEVDLGALSDFEAVIHVSDLKVPAGVVVLDEAEEVIAFVEEPRSDEELAEMEEPVAEGELPESEHGGGAEAEEGAAEAEGQEKE